MKKNPIIRLLILMFFCFDMNLVYASNITSIYDNISFYKVPFVCNAAPSIGCGSRSKPVLLDLEESDIVKEAWLNRQGNVIGVVWVENANLEDRKKVVRGVFATHKVNATELLMEDYANNLESFKSIKGWYKSTDVNALSKEEAGIIADQLLEEIKRKTTLNKSDEGSYKEEIQNVFYELFINYESLDQLRNADVYKGKLLKIIEIGEKYVGKGNMPSVDDLWKVCSGGTSGCDHEVCNNGKACNRDSSCGPRS